MEFGPEEGEGQPRTLLDRVDSVLIGGLGLAALLLASVNVLLRTFLPHLTIEWGDEVQVYLVVWAVCLAFGALTASGRHIRADLFVALLPAGGRAALATFADLLGLAVSAVLFWFALLATWEAWDFGDVSTTTLRFPLWIYQAALPTGMALMALRHAIRLARRLGGRPA